MYGFFKVLEINYCFKSSNAEVKISFSTKLMCRIKNVH